MTQDKYVYFFGSDQTDGSAEMRSLLGGKGANLAEMTSLGIPVPPGFTISTETGRLYHANNNQYPDGLDEQIDENLGKTRGSDGCKVRGYRKSAARLCQIWSSGLNARYDGHHPSTSA